MFLYIKLSLVAMAVTVSLSAPAHSPVSVNDPQDEIVVTEGTPLNLITAKEIITREAKPDDAIDFSVAEDLVINGQVIVRKGTPAVGSVIIPAKGGYLGKSGKLAIHIDSTTTSDGKRLKLRAAKNREGDDKTTSAMLPTIIDPALLFQQGREPKIAPGRVVTVYVGEEKRFRVEGATLVPVVTKRRRLVQKQRQFLSTVPVNTLARLSSLRCLLIRPKWHEWITGATSQSG